MELVFKAILGVEYAITANYDEYLAYRGARLNYSLNSIDAKEVFIQTSGFLAKKGVEKFSPSAVKKNGMTFLFYNTSTTCNAGFDPFAAIFFLVTRYEEYCCFKPDKHGRFAAEESIAHKNNFLQVPIVNHYALFIKDLIVRKHPGIDFKPPGYMFIPTYDVDVAYAYWGRGVVRNVAASIKDIVKGNKELLTERVKVLRNLQRDPYDIYDYTLGHDSNLELQSVYFFLCGNYGAFDRNISPFSNTFIKLVKKVGDSAFCGIHPSYQSNNSPEKIGTEKERLSKILSREIRFSRQHFLKFKLPETYQNLLKNNIDNDFSMGYASQLGFRASIATPFYFYDLEREEATSLKVHPLALMDTTLIGYLQLSPIEAAKKGKEIVDEVKRVGGTFISLWHNETLSNRAQSKPWRDCYEQISIHALPNKL